jgi:hypothetical protein
MYAEFNFIQVSARLKKKNTYLAKCCEQPALQPNFQLPATSFGWQYKTTIATPEISILAKKTKTIGLDIITLLRKIH